MLAELAEHRAPSATQRGSYALKAAAWTSFDPLYTSLVPRDRSAALDAAKRAGWDAGSQIALPAALHPALHGAERVLDSPLTHRSVRQRQDLCCRLLALLPSFRADAD